MLYKNENIEIKICFHLFSQHLTKQYILKKIRRVEIINSPAGFELMIYKFVGYVLNYCSTLLDSNLGKKYLQHYTWYYCLFRSEIRHDTEVSHTTLTIFAMSRHRIYDVNFFWHHSLKKFYSYSDSLLLVILIFLFHVLNTKLSKLLTKIEVS